MATLIRPDGSCSEVLPKNGKDFSLKEIQKHVGGYVQFVTGQNGKNYLCDEDGIAKRLKPNKVASERIGTDVLGNVLELLPDELK
jgi:hypothetical protein